MVHWKSKVGSTTISPLYTNRRKLHNEELHSLYSSQNIININR